MNGDEQNKKKLRSDAMFGKINQFVTLQKDETAKYNSLFTKVTESIVSILKEKDEVFKKYYRNTMYAGSFYKQTRVGQPKEFDLNLILCLPDIDSVKIEKGRPGFAKIKFDERKISSVWTEHKVLNKWLDSEGYLDNGKLRGWFEGMVKKSLNPSEKNSNKFRIYSKDSSSPLCEAEIKKSGPAFTLIVNDGSMEFAVDLVPVLEFSQSPPLSNFEKLKEPWHLVPKPLKNGDVPNQNWRYCFYHYEKEMLKKNGKVKPIIRHIKKLRDTQNWSILASYYIETLFFHVLSKNDFDQNESQTRLLVYMLKELSKAFKSGLLNYFWDKTFNLFGELTEDQIVGVQNRLDKIIKEIEADPTTMTQYFLTKEEQKKLKEIEEKEKTQPKKEVNDKTNGLSSTFPLIRETKSEKNKKIIQESENRETSKNEIKALKEMVLSLKAEFKDFKNSIKQKPIDQTPETEGTDEKEMKKLLLLLINEVKQLKLNVGRLETKIDQTNEQIKNIKSQSTFFDVMETGVPLLN
ncbi:cyclic GMP-AMP synthase-like receptor isoform X2 [Microplitis demolitor]|uniref:cyclic GMP-AMP synthase-like receptor isoform X2 n=1 Tax=Microplitis demolitor TaxID=69319 RepID=UPI0004CCA9AA|nr:cyclic GMP-AMP synthase-like receptor isoform X2 [Microplitis demolitor]